MRLLMAPRFLDRSDLADYPSKLSHYNRVFIPLSFRCRDRSGWQRDQGLRLQVVVRSSTKRYRGSGRRILRPRPLRWPPPVRERRQDGQRQAAQHRRKIRSGAILLFFSQSESFDDNPEPFLRKFTLKRRIRQQKSSWLS